MTAFVGRNEAGKTALLKALHKFNPATEEAYNAQREFPRDRFTAEYRDGGDWPVCRVEFELSAEFRKELGERLNSAKIPQKAILTRYYDGSLEYEYDKEISDDPVDPAELATALGTFAKGARRLAVPTEDQEDATQALRTKLADWADGNKEAAGKLQDLRTEAGIELLRQVRQSSIRDNSLLKQHLGGILGRRVDGRGGDVVRAYVCAPQGAGPRSRLLAHLSHHAKA